MLETIPLDSLTYIIHKDHPNLGIDFMHRSPFNGQMEKRTYVLETQDLPRRDEIFAAIQERFGDQAKTTETVYTTEWVSWLVVILIITVVAGFYSFVFRGPAPTDDMLWENARGRIPHYIAGKIGYAMGPVGIGITGAVLAAWPLKRMLQVYAEPPRKVEMHVLAD